jgi:DNA-binding transcriptional regulator YhcF (GntR family)
MSPLPQGLETRVDRASDLPLGAQLARSLRDWIAHEDPGTRLPSVRELAASAGVNVNTARAVYQRLENEGLISSEQGRGTFVAERPRPRGEAAERAELRRQIAVLEGELASRPPAPTDPFSPPPRQPARLMSADALREVRDDLIARLRSLDQERAEVLERLAELEAEDRILELEDEAAERADAEPRRSTLSVRGARVRWVGA